mgnify:CR=1 FL=1
MFQNKINSDSEIAYNLYGMIIQKDYKNALEIVKTHSNFSFTSNSSKLLFNICSAIVKKELLLISEKQAEIDVNIFVEYIAPVLNIKKRYRLLVPHQLKSKQLYKN